MCDVFKRVFRSDLLIFSLVISSYLHVTIPIKISFVIMTKVQLTNDSLDIVVVMSVCGKHWWWFIFIIHTLVVCVYEVSITFPLLFSLTFYLIFFAFFSFEIQLPKSTQHAIELFWFALGWPTHSIRLCSFNILFLLLSFSSFVLTFSHTHTHMIYNPNVLANIRVSYLFFWTEKQQQQHVLAGRKQIVSKAFFASFNNFFVFLIILTKIQKIILQSCKVVERKLKKIN